MATNNAISLPCQRMEPSPERRVYLPYPTLFSSPVVTGEVLTTALSRGKRWGALALLVEKDVLIELCPFGAFVDVFRHIQERQFHIFRQGRVFHIGRNIVVLRQNLLPVRQEKIDEQHRRIGVRGALGHAGARRKSEHRRDVELGNWRAR